MWSLCFPLPQTPPWWILCYPAILNCQIKKTSVIFASSYLVPDTFAIYYQIRVPESAWVHLTCLKGTPCTLPESVFWEGHEAEAKIKRETMSTGLMAARWTGSFIDTVMGIKNGESTPINLWLHLSCHVNMYYLLSAYWSRPCTRLSISIWCGSCDKLPQMMLCKESQMEEQSFKGDSFGI